TLLLATGSFTNLPPGTDTVIAVPGTGDCTAPEARTINPSDFRLIPGDWTFYAGGDAFECSPGPSPVELSAGDTGETAWGTTTLRVDGAPSDGTLWALHASKVAGLLTTCPDPSDVSDAINVNAARGAELEIAAGD